MRNSIFRIRFVYLKLFIRFFLKKQTFCFIIQVSKKIEVYKVYNNIDTERFVKDVMRLVSQEFGKNCEVVLHDWSQNYDKTIVAIENGHVTGRKIGDCGSNLGLEVMRGTTDGSSQVNYVTKTRDNKMLRSSTLYIKDIDGKPLGALCINYDITDILAANEVLKDMATLESKEEHFAKDVNELLDYLLGQSEIIVGKQASDMTKEDKMKALKYLDEKGALLITKSGSKICKYFGISKYTLYNYLEEIRENVEEKE